MLSEFFIEFLRELNKGSDGGEGSGLVGLHMKGTPPGELFAVSRHQLALGGAVPPGSARSQMLKHQGQKLENMVITRSYPRDLDYKSKF